jgi:hypothetical protein
MVDEGLDPVCGGEGDGPEVGGRVVEGEGYFEDLAGASGGWSTRRGVD